MVALARHISLVSLDLAADLAARMVSRALRHLRFLTEDADFHRCLIEASGNQFALAWPDLFGRVISGAQAHGLPWLQMKDAPTSALEHVWIIAESR